ncbi:hypothetical protein M569_13165, partial [Genlisea aurea]
LVFLIDSGSTHSFIQEEVARKMGLDYELRRDLRATVAHGDSIKCGGVSLGVPIQIGDYSCECNLYWLPIAGYKGILGYDWISQLGAVRWDFTQKNMTF